MISKHFVSSKPTQKQPSSLKGPLTGYALRSVNNTSYTQSTFFDHIQVCLNKYPLYRRGGAIVTPMILLDNIIPAIKIRVDLKTGRFKSLGNNLSEMEIIFSGGLTVDYDITDFTTFVRDIALLITEIGWPEFIGYPVSTSPAPGTTKSALEIHTVDAKGTIRDRLIDGASSALEEWLSGTATLPALVLDTDNIIITRLPSITSTEKAFALTSQFPANKHYRFENTAVTTPMPSVKGLMSLAGEDKTIISTSRLANIILPFKELCALKLKNYGDRSTRVTVAPINKTINMKHVVGELQPLTDKEYRKVVDLLVDEFDAVTFDVNEITTVSFSSLDNELLHICIQCSDDDVHRMDLITIPSRPYVF